MKFLAISGSLRKISSNTALLRAAAKLAPDGIEIALYEGLGNLPPFNPDMENAAPPSVMDFRDRLRTADGILISTPEYAHGVPGVLKNALDWIVGSGELVYKPVALLNASPRSTYAQESLKETLSVMTATIAKEACVDFPLPGKKLDADGIAANPDLSKDLRSALTAFAAAVKKQPAKNDPMRTYLLNPTLKDQKKFIREGRCMQKASSWATAWPPITLAMLGGMAERSGQVRLMDGNVESIGFEELCAELREFKPDLLVVNTGFPSIDQDMDVAKRIKELFPDVKVLAFGVYFTLLEQAGYSHYPFLDFAIVGEPEETFGELIQSLNEGSPSLSEVKGLIYKEEEVVRVNPPHPKLSDLDALPFPARHLLKNDLYRLPHNNEPFTLINGARGCPFPCTYCIVSPYSGKTVRKHSIPYLIQEIRMCKEKYGIHEFLLWEEVFCLDRDHVKEFCEALLSSDLNIRWAATTRAGTMDPEILALMKKSGCYLIGLGIESGSQEILDAAKKNQSLSDVRRAVALAKDAKIKTMGHFIFGLPGETKKTAEETIRFMLSLGLDYMQCYCAVPYPKTELGETARTNGWVREANWSEFDFGGNSVMRTNELTCEEIDNFRRNAFMRFYFRPGYIFNKLFRDVSIWQLARLARFGDWMNLFGARKS